MPSDYDKRGDEDDVESWWTRMNPTANAARYEEKYVDGCTYCGLRESKHGTVVRMGPGWHVFHEPSVELRRRRIKAMLAATKAPTETDTNEESKMTSIGRRDVIKSRMAALEAELAKFERFPDDTFDDGTAWRFTKVLRTYGEEDAKFTYVALKVGGRWWLTGMRTVKFAEGGISYDALIEFIGDADVYALNVGEKVA